MLKRGAAAVVLAVCFAATPNRDSRNSDVPGPKTHFEMVTYSSRSAWMARRDQLRKQILSAAGLLPTPHRPPLRSIVTRTIEREGYAIDSLLLETLPGYFTGANLYRPTGLTRPAPGILIPHGHWKGGRLENQPVYSVPALGINLAKQGYFALAWDMVGYNDTRQTSHSFSGWQEDLWSFHPMGLQLWNSIRALDFLEGVPGVDPKRIAITGASGGGTQTFLLTAVDDRISASAPVNMISAYMQGDDPCEESPGLRVSTFNVEFAAMAAPRPMLVVSSTKDWTRHTPDEEFPAIRRVYALFGAAAKLHHAHIDAVHNYNRTSREAVYKFFAAQLRPERPSSVDEDVAVPPETEMLAVPKSDSPHGAVAFAELFERWRAAAVLQMQALESDRELRDTLRVTLGAEWPDQVESWRSGEQIVLGRPGVGDRLTGRWFPGKGAPVLLVHPEGVEAGLRMPVASQVREQGRPLLVLQPFESSGMRLDHQQDSYFLSYNRSDGALRVQDILTALCFLRGQSRRAAELIGVGAAGPWTLFAAAVAPVPVDVLADLDGFGGSDQDFRTRFFVPGIQRAGGLITALRITNHVRAALPAHAEESSGNLE